MERSIMECSDSSWNDDFVLEISDDEGEPSIIIDQVIDHQNHKNTWRRRTFEKETAFLVDVESESRVKHEYSANSLSLETDDFPDKMINVSKLMSQLFSAKVVIEKIRETSPSRDEHSQKKRTEISNELPSDDIKNSVQLYCVKCKTLKMDNHSLYSKKACPDCHETMKYLCFKCNNKLYTTYFSYKLHWLSCGVTGATTRRFKPSDFIVGRALIADYSSIIIRYCSTCKEKSTTYISKKVRCKSCDRYLLYQCNKCEAHYKGYEQIAHHLRTKCYPNYYKCNQCDYTTPCWRGMRRHLRNVKHSDESELRCPKCEGACKDEESMREHIEICGPELDLNCKWCAFKTRNPKALKHHASTIHDEYSDI